MTKFLENLKELLKSPLEAVFPKKLTCAVCRKELQESVEGICPECYGRLPFLSGKTCLKCGQPLENLSNYCNRCKDEEIFYKSAAAVFEYDNKIKNLIFRFKSDNQKYLADFFGLSLAQKYATLNYDGDLAMYVPIHKNTLKKRGFNQSELLCKKFSALSGVPVSNGNLVKIVDTGQQKFLTKAERIKNLEKSFFVNFKSGVKGKNIILIDDIMTTGATANECAKVLNAAGAKNVYILCLATVKLKIAEEENFKNN